MISFHQIVVAHRGLHDSLPENSLAAMCAAWHAGITWCECDVHFSADGIPIVIHDDTLDRTTTGTGSVADFPASELHELHLLGPDGKPTAHRLPLLEELLEQCGPGRHLLVETKPLLGKRILSITAKIHAKQGMIQSFHLDDMVVAMEGGCRAAALVKTCEGHLSKNFRGSFHVHHESLNPLSLGALGHAGAWTVNDPDKIRQIAAMENISMIITDIPLVAIQIVGRPSGI